jgi:uncharacterized protein
MPIEMLSAERDAAWTQTFTGKRFWPLDPRPEDICIEDIAHALGNICRYSGHCKPFYSVAEHSVILSHYVPKEFALWALLHDAEEAYLADIPRPIKHLIPGWHQIAERVQNAVCDKFGLPREMPEAVKIADHAILADEKAALMVDGPKWSNMIPPLGAHIYCFEPVIAGAVFLRRFQVLTNG